MQITLRVILPPFFTSVECRVQVQKIREETTCRHLASQPVKIIIAVGWQITHPAFFLPNLNWKDSRFAIPHTPIGALQKFTDHATPFGRGVRSVINRTEHHLIPSARMNRVHIMNKSLHRLMYTSHGTVHRMLDNPRLSNQPVQRLFQIIF